MSCEICAGEDGGGGGLFGVFCDMGMYQFVLTYL